MPEEFRIGLFEGVWQGIRDAYVDPETNGLDWEAIGDEYAPLIIATDNAYEVYELLGEMVALLDDPYTGYFAPEDLGDPDEPVDPSYGGIGALVDTGAAGEGSEGLRITYVFDGGSAKESGVLPRDRVIAVNGDPCARVADIRGPEGTSVTAHRCLTGPGAARRHARAAPHRAAHPPGGAPAGGGARGRLPARHLTLRPGGHRRHRAGPHALRPRRAARRPHHRPARLEPGRAGRHPGGPAALRLRRRRCLPLPSGTEPIEIEPSDLADDYADVPVVVLVDETTEADAEQMAAILQDQGRAPWWVPRLRPTHGAQTIDFADGSLLQVVTYGFQLPDGQTLEGQGVTPDVEVTADWLDYPESEDPGILAALEVIESVPARPRSRVTGCHALGARRAIRRHRPNHKRPTPINWGDHPDVRRPHRG